MRTQERPTPALPIFFTKARSWFLWIRIWRGGLQMQAASRSTPLGAPKCVCNDELEPSETHQRVNVGARTDCSGIFGA
jgi:hypothetical protein